MDQIYSKYFNEKTCNFSLRNLWQSSTVLTLHFSREHTIWNFTIWESLNTPISHNFIVFRIAILISSYISNKTWWKKIIQRIHKDIVWYSIFNTLNILKRAFFSKLRNDKLYRSETDLFGYYTLMNFVKICLRFK